MNQPFGVGPQGYGGAQVQPQGSLYGKSNMISMKAETDEFGNFVSHENAEEKKQIWTGVSNDLIDLGNLKEESNKKKDEFLF